MNLLNMTGKTVIINTGYGILRLPPKDESISIKRNTSPYKDASIPGFYGANFCDEEIVGIDSIGMILSDTIIIVSERVFRFQQHQYNGVETDDGVKVLWATPLIQIGQSESESVIECGGLIIMN